MLKLFPVFHASLLFSFLALLPQIALADSSGFPMVLESKDPAKPLEIIDDKTWVGSEMKQARNSWGDLALASFTNDSSKGPITLVVDYAATRPEGEDGEALIEIGIECPESETPCEIPINQSVMGIRSAFMGESAIKVAGSPQAVWVARESHTYYLPADTVVSVSLSLDQPPTNLEPLAIRARLFYGDYSRDALPGQETRIGIFGKIGITVLLILIGFIWWMRRQ
jgi:hypothetical protein